MASTVFQGFYSALFAGLLETTPDLRAMVVMSAFTGEAEPEAINPADITTLDEWDALGYLELDCASVTVTYDAASHRVYIDFANGASDEFGDPVAPGSEVAYGLLLKLYVDGTAANDYVLGFTTDGFGINAANGAVGLTLPALGLMFVAEA